MTTQLEIGDILPIGTAGTHRLVYIGNGRCNVETKCPERDAHWKLTNSGKFSWSVNKPDQPLNEAQIAAWIARKSA